jgi:hypothetical protein
LVFCFGIIQLPGLTDVPSPRGGVSVQQQQVLLPFPSFHSAELIVTGVTQRNSQIFLPHTVANFSDKFFVDLEAFRSLCHGGKHLYDNSMQARAQDGSLMVKAFVERIHRI